MSKNIGRKNIVLAYDKYQGQDGQEKTNWRTLGEIVMFQGDDGKVSEIVNLWTMPGASIRVFPPKDKQQTQQPTQQPAQPTQTVAPTPPAEIPIVNVGVPTQPLPQDEISVDQIPF